MAQRKTLTDNYHITVPSLPPRRADAKGNALTCITTGSISFFPLSPTQIKEQWASHATNKRILGSRRIGVTLLIAATTVASKEATSATADAEEAKPWVGVATSRSTGNDVIGYDVSQTLDGTT